VWWQWPETVSRGGSIVTSFDASLLHDAPPTANGPISEEELWANLEYFLRRVVPVAEKANVKLAMHPDDPPLSPIRGVGRIVRSPENYQRLLDLVPSPVNGITLCQGNFTLMTNDLPGVIRHFGRQKKVFFVHFRDVRGTLVAGVVSVAGAYPANVAPRSEVEDDDGRTIVVRFADTGVRFVVDRQAMYLYEDAYIYKQAIAGSTRFPEGAVERMRAGLVGLPPKMLLQRLGVLPGIASTTGFQGKRIRIIAGTEDPAHTREIEGRTVDLLRSWGADASLVWLGDRGIHGNGHFLFFETNSDEVLEVVEEQIHAVTRT